MSNDDKMALKEWRLSHPDEFGQSKRKVIDSRKGGNSQSKRQKSNNYNSSIKAQIQSVTDKLLNAKLKDLDGEKSKKVSFKVSEANAEAWIEEAMKKINEKNGSVGAVTVKELMKEVHAAPQGINATISSKKPPKSQKK